MGKRMNKWLAKQKPKQPVPAVELKELWGLKCLNLPSAFRPKPVEAKKPLNNGWSYGAWLEKRGFKLLGRGSYSHVYAKDGSDRVIKVTAGHQDNWIDYIQWAAKKGYCGNFAPRVYSWKKLLGKDGSTFSVSVVERMKTTLNNSNNRDDKLIETLMYPAIHRKSLMAQVYLDDLVPGCVPFLSELVSTFNANDLYGKNMMFREDGSFCVTDPVCGQSFVTTNRLRSRDFTSLGPATLRIDYGRFLYA